MLIHILIFDTNIITYIFDDQVWNDIFVEDPEIYSYSIEIIYINSWLF